MHAISRRRNVAFVGPHHAGKTTLVEAILAHCGAIPRRGNVADGTTTTDYEPECIEHAQSTCVAFAHANCGEIDVSIIDCPGFVDFFEETKLAMQAADAVVIVLEPDAARVAQTRALLAFIEQRRMPHLFVINKMDRPGADFEATLNALGAAYGRNVVAEVVPIGAGESFSGYVDLTDRSAHGADGASRPVDGDLTARIDKAREILLEALGDHDDHLLEELLDGIEPPLEEVRRDLREECSHDLIVPVLATSASLGIGVDALVQTIAEQFPAPDAQERKDAAGRTVAPNPDGPVIAQVCKTYIHPQSGKLSVVRVFSGTLRGDMTFTDVSRGDLTARASGLFRLQGKKQEPLDAAGPGEIVAVARLEGVMTGDTITTNGDRSAMPTVPLTEPVFGVAIRPKERLDEAKLSQTLARILEEDPTLRLVRAEFTNELQLLGNGEAHVSIAAERLARKYKVALETGPPAIPYRETITSSTEVHARYKHQTGGHGQFADVKLRIEPRERGHGVTFEEQIVGGVVPRQFFPAVEKGVREALMHGPLGGFPVVDLHVVLFDGAFHEVDSSEASFKTAAAMAIRDGIPKCSPQLLEPIVELTVSVPEAYASTVLGQITGKRGSILAFEPAGDGDYRVRAYVPQVELARYITELRTASQGLGSYTWRHDRFEFVPPKIAQALREMSVAT